MMCGETKFPSYAYLAIMVLSISAFVLSDAVRSSNDIRKSVYSQKFSSVPYSNFSGGTYKASNIRNFPASTTMSGSLVNLLRGGLREPHWHNPNEWAYVINGTCRATLVDQGPNHPAESWDFQAGDIWYFPSNVGHAVLGLEHGCSYLAVYDEGDFDESINGRGLSYWLSSAPPDIVAQALGTSEDSIVASISPKTNGFIQLGDLDKLTAGQSDAPLLAARGSPLGRLGQLQSTSHIHRYVLSLGQIPESNNSGGWIKLADPKVFPISKSLIGAIVYTEPYSLRQMHWHLGMDEWQYVLNGTFELGIFEEPGKVTRQSLSPGDVGFVPRGTGHWIKNTSPQPGFLILVFNSPTFTNVDLPGWLGSFPASYAAVALNITEEFASSWTFTRGDGIVGKERGDYRGIASTRRGVNQD